MSLDAAGDECNGEESQQLLSGRPEQRAHPEQPQQPQQLQQQSPPRPTVASLPPDFLTLPDDTWSPTAAGPQSHLTPSPSAQQQQQPNAGTPAGPVPVQWHSPQPPPPAADLSYVYPTMLAVPRIYAAHGGPQLVLAVPRHSLHSLGLPVGVLNVHLKHAELHKNYGLLKMDPYVRARVGPVVVDSSVCHRGGCSPVWNEWLQLCVARPSMTHAWCACASGSHVTGAPGRCIRTSARSIW